MSTLHVCTIAVLLCTCTLFSQVKEAEEEVIPSKPAKPTTRYVGDERA